VKRKSSGRGGKRAGAGRPRKLSQMQQWAIGSQYQRLWDELARRLAAKQIDAFAEDLREAQARLNEVPISLRRAWPIGTPPPEKHQIGQRYLDVREEIQDLRAGQGLPTTRSEEGVMLSAIIRRPQGRRPVLLKFVAAMASKRYCVRISADYVIRCVKEFRKMTQRFDFHPNQNDGPEG
jgi:hypothetical protein